MEVRRAEVMVSHGDIRPGFVIPLPFPWARWAGGVAIGVAVVVAAFLVFGTIVGVIIALAVLAQALVAAQRRPQLTLTTERVARVGPIRTDRWEWDASGLPDHPAVAIYGAAPHRRAAIGTPEEHERLTEELRGRGT